MVLPTDTVYGVGADAFNPAAVSALLAAKGRGRNMPPPVLVGSVRAAAALTESLGAFGQDLIDEFWPGPLTLVFRSSPTLMWDLGDTMGTVAVRMPLHPVALDLLRRTGPMAVSSANRHSLPAATTAEEAQTQLGDAISVYLDGGPCADNVPSTILDLTGTVPRMLRAGRAVRRRPPEGRPGDRPARRGQRGAGAQPGRPPRRRGDRRRERGQRGQSRRGDGYRQAGRSGGRSRYQPTDRRPPCASISSS